MESLFCFYSVLEKEKYFQSMSGLNTTPIVVLGFILFFKKCSTNDGQVFLSHSSNPWTTFKCPWELCLHYALAHINSCMYICLSSFIFYPSLFLSHLDIKKKEKEKNPPKSRSTFYMKSFSMNASTSAEGNYMDTISFS